MHNTTTRRHFLQQSSLLAAGLATLGPRHFGWDVEFTPIERLVRSS